MLELSLREALQLKHNYIGTEHLLLGLLREGEGLGAQILVDKHPLDEIRADVLERVKSPGAHETPGGARTPAARDVLTLAAELAGEDQSAAITSWKRSCSSRTAPRRKCSPTPASTSTSSPTSWTT